MKKSCIILTIIGIICCFSGSLFAYDGYESPIRVHLTSTSSPVAVKAAEGTYQVLNGSGSVVATVNQGDSYTLNSGQSFSSVNGYGKIGYNDKVYRGDLIHNGGYVVNKLPMEWYLYSVVSMEIGGYSPGIEALKTQAVASRSFASIKYKNPRTSYYDILSTTSDQAYGGFGEEKYDAIGKLIRQACNETAGQVCYYDGVLANTIFCANTGGYTEDAAVVWGGNYPYMKAVVSPYDSMGFESTYYTSSGSSYKSFKMPTSYQWVKTFTFDELSAKIGGIGTINAISVENTTGGYAKNVTFVGSGGSKTLSGEKVRSALGFRSGSFTVTVGKSVSAKSTFAQQLLDSNQFGQFLSRANGTVTFEGRGYGHSVGLSQWGACVMGSQGFTYQQILNYYYNQNQNNGRLTIEKYKG